MSSTPENPDQSAHPVSEPSAMEKAIRARALAAIEQEVSRPPMPVQRRVLIIVFVLMAIAGFLISVNFVVTGMHRIMDIWYPGSISDRAAPQPEPAAPGTAGSDRPFVISVVPASGEQASSK